MAHQSENAKRLALRVCDGIPAVADLNRIDASAPAVYAFILPFGRTVSDSEASSQLWEALRDLSARAHPESTIAILTTPPDAAALWVELELHLRFQLWIAVKLARPTNSPGQLPQNHAALLILTKYNDTLRHTKTRIAYTYCPACRRTTKDYGGKKHTYHEYGTLVSDVWRDTAYDPDELPVEVLSRLQDLFGLPPYENLRLLDLRHVEELRPRPSLLVKDVNTEDRSDAGIPTGLVRGDCLEALPSIPSESVDFCFADPPYNLKKRYDSWDDTLDITRYFQWCDEWLTELARVLKPGRTCAVLNIPQWAIRHFSHMRKLLRYQCWIAWEGLSLPVRMIMPAHYSIVCFAKGTPRDLPGLTEQTGSDMEMECLRPLAESFCLRSSCVERRRARRLVDTSPITDLWWDIHRLKHNTRRVDHPCQLPPALMRRLIALFTSRNELVLDPFNGAGTTTLAAEQLGRRFIGMELSEQYHALALKRHEELRAGLDPFRKTDSVPRAKNSYVKRLEKQQYAVSKKALQLEVKRIAKELGHLPTRDEVKRLSVFPLEYYEKYFISWGEVCAAARTTGMSEYLPDDPRAQRNNQMPLFEVSP